MREGGKNMYRTEGINTFIELMAMLAASRAMMLASSFVIIIIAILLIIATWKTFIKAGVEGWKCIIPIYGQYCLYEIALGNGWWFLVAWFPGVGTLLARVLLGLKLTKAFGKGIGFAIGMILLPVVFRLILGFGSAEYEGPESIFD